MQIHLACSWDEKTMACKGTTGGGGGVQAVERTPGDIYFYSGSLDCFRQNDIMYPNIKEPCG